MDFSEDANFNIEFLPLSPPRSVQNDSDSDHQSPSNISEFDIHCSDTFITNQGLGEGRN